MKRFTIIILCFGLNSCPAFSQNSNKPIYDYARKAPNLFKVERNNIINKKISITKINEYRYEKQESVRIKIKESILNYDSFGNILYRINKRSKSCDTVTYFRKYDIHGNIISQRIINSNNGDCSVDSFSYNLNGKLVEINNYDENYKLEYRQVIQYDSLDNTIKNVVWDKYSTAKEETTDFSYKYDSKGNIIRSYVNGKLSSEMSYDSNSNRTMASDITEDETRIFSYEYSKSNNMIYTKCLTYRTDKLVYEYVHRYDNNNNVIESFSKDYSGRSNIASCIYNDKNEIIKTEIKEYQHDTLNITRIYTYNRKYDSKGSLVYLEEITSIYSKEELKWFDHLLTEYEYKYSK